MKSRLYLARLETPPPTILDYLMARFPQISPSMWKERVARGLVTTQDGTPVLMDSAYRQGLTILYEREVPLEPPAEEAEVILHQDASILVADKPHGIPVTPAGSYVKRSLLARLQRGDGLSELAPMHRLDRDTAGLVLFAIKAEGRGPYHQLFAEGKIQREYLAVANLANTPDERRWHVESRIEAGEPWYRQRNGEGPINAVTVIELMECEKNRGLFRLLPMTGRKHQLRLHMASIGFPIIGDTVYPEVRTKQDGEPPLQLLARRLEFVDPVCAMPRIFVSARKLLWFS
jgi:tRNA pseudouridine32 synthase / 23S rRNA pseudouridine746 synthase